MTFVPVMTFGSVMIALAVIFLMAFLVETLVEFVFAPLFNNIPALGKIKWAQFYLAVVLAVIGAFLYQFDIFYLLAQFLGSLFMTEPAVAMTPYGIALTGVGIGHGAAYMHDAVMRHFRKPQVPA